MAYQNVPDMLAPAATVYGATGAGAGYKTGDVVTLSAFSTLANITSTGYSTTRASFTLTVSNGNVTAVTLKDSGDYPWGQSTSPIYPSNPVSVAGGSGTGLKLTVAWPSVSDGVPANSASGDALNDSGL